jgi:hypothetical protein
VIFVIFCEYESSLSRILSMTRIHLYNHVEDAWQASLADWLDRRSLASLDGDETWLVTGSYFQANWIRRMALSRNKSLFGIQVFDRRSLRQHLARACGLPEQFLGREALQVLLDTTAAEAALGYTGTGSLLSALDLLGASGALDRLGADAVCEMFDVPEALRPTIKEITSSSYWTSRLDLLLLDGVAPRKGLHLGLFGFDPENLRELNLLLAAAKRAEQTDLWTAQPLGKEELGFNWISVLERALQTEATVCPTGEADRPFEDFLGQWQGGAGARRVAPPEIIIGKRWVEQVDGIVRRVAKALVEQAQSVLVVVQENSPTGNAVVNALISRGIAVADEIKETKSLPRAAESQIALAQFLSRDRTPEDFLRIVQCLLRSQDGYRAFREALLRSFEVRQTRSVAVLTTDELRERFPWLPDLEQAVQPLPERATWNEFSRLWEALLERISTTANTHKGMLAPINLPEDKPIWRDLGPLLEGRMSTSQLFLQFVIRSLSAQAREPHPESHHRYSKVCVATASKTHATSWDCVILADSVADGWPLAPAPNPLLTDETKIQLRQHRFLILTASEQRAVQEERYLQLAYSAKRNLVLARHEQDENGIELVPNNVSTFSGEFLKAPVTRVRTESVRTQDEATARFAKICANRSDPATPFDDYFLNFKGLNIPARAWHPSELETVLKTPATFAFRLMFDCRREYDRGFVRSASMTVGSLTHRLLQRGFAGSGQFLALDPLAKWSREQACMQILHAMEVEIARKRKELMPDNTDLWWETILSKAFMFATQMLEQVSDRFEDGHWYHSESALKGALPTARGALKLEGRTDLILSDRENLESTTPVICDFKTSSRVQRFDADSGENLQFLGYRILAEVNGALGTEFLVVKPDSLKSLDLPTNEELTGLTALLARLQTERSFGRRPPEKWESTEKLPIATLPIDAAVLERKLELTWN